MTWTNLNDDLSLEVALTCTDSDAVLCIQRPIFPLYFVGRCIPKARSRETWRVYMARKTYHVVLGTRADVDNKDTRCDGCGWHLRVHPITPGVTP